MSNAVPGPAAQAIVAKLRAAGCVFAEQEAQVLLASAAGPAELATMLEQRISGSPLEHVVGWAQFCGLRIVVGPGVFVPRRRSEFLVQQAIALAGAAMDAGRRPIVADLCCGTGAVAAAVLAALEDVDVYAGDIDPVAVGYARRNLASAGGRVGQGDLFGALPDQLRGRIDVVVANTPYVPTDEIDLLPAEARLFEPPVALDGGADGLDVQRRLARAAPRWLAPGGHLLVEISTQQAQHTAHAFAQHGLVSRLVHSAELDATVVIGRLTAAYQPAGSGRPS